MIRFKLILCCLLSGATLTVEAAPKRAPKAKPAPLPAAVQTQLEGRLGERMKRLHSPAGDERGRTVARRTF
ncbi:MAG: hypothetical protein ACLR8Y_02500 [Alistipes indistinctus]